jgi:membrane protein
LESEESQKVKSFDLGGRVRAMWSAAKFYALGLIERIDQNHVLLNAGGLTFSIFVCVIPLILIVFTGLGIMYSGPEVKTEIESFIDRAIPYPQYAVLAKQIVLGMAEEFRVHRNLSGLIGAVGLLIAASGLFSSMRTVLNVAYRVKSGPSVLVGKLQDFLMTLAVVCAFLFSMLILPVWESVVDSAQKIGLNGLHLGGLGDILANVVSLVVVFLMFGAVYTTVPARRQPMRVVLVSAAVAAVFWEAAKELFGWYLTNLATFTRVYGAYTFLIVIGFWIYYSAVLFAIGAELGQLYRERRRILRHRPSRDGRYRFFR